MNKHKILVADDYNEEFFMELAKYGEVIKTSNIDDNAELTDVTILVVRSKTKVNKQLVDRMPSLKCVISATHGTDHVDLRYLEEKKIQFHNVPVQAYDIAQGVMAYILAHATNVVKGDRFMKRKEWKKKELNGCRIKGKILGIIGYGRIGKEVLKLASALGMNVIAYDPYVRDNRIGATLDTLLKQSDFITLHVPLTSETHMMIGKKEFDKMKKGAYLINTARGGIIDEVALFDALNEEKLSGAALDVYQHRSVFEKGISRELIRDERVIATPHSVGQTNEAVNEKGDGVIEVIKKLQWT